MARMAMFELFSQNLKIWNTHERQPQECSVYIKRSSYCHDYDTTAFNAVRYYPTGKLYGTCIFVYARTTNMKQMTPPHWYYTLVNQSIIMLTHNDFAFMSDHYQEVTGTYYLYLSNPVAIIKFFMFNWLSMLSMLTWLCCCTGVLPRVVTSCCWNLPMNDLLLISLTKTRTSHDFSWSIDYSVRFSMRYIQVSLPICPWIIHISEDSLLNT